MTTFKKCDDKNFTINFVTSKFITTKGESSTKYDHNGLKWRLTVSKTIAEDNEDLLSVYLCCDGNGSTLWSADVEATISLIKKDGGMRLTKIFDQKMNSSSKSWGFENFLSIEPLNSHHYIKDGKLSIECAVKLDNVSGVSLKRKHRFEVCNPKLSNIVLKVNGKEFHVNGGFLSTHSNVFYELIYPLGLNGKAEIEHTIDDVTHEDFDEFLQCMYYLQDINQNNVESLLKLADRFKVEMIKRQCEQFLISTTNVTKLAKLDYAENYSLPDLQISIMDSITNCDEIGQMCDADDDLGNATVRALLKKAVVIMRE